MPDVESKRLFVAVQLPPPIEDILSTCQKKLQKSGSDAKWVEPQNIHLTLKFLGSVPIDIIESLAKTLDKLFGQFKKFEVTLSVLGCFPSQHSVRVVWAGLEDKNNTLKGIAAKLDDALLKLGFEKESRDFQAHATLARVRSPRNQTSLIEKIKEANQEFKNEKFLIDNITLFESKLNPKGPTYSIIHQVKFK